MSLKQLIKQITPPLFLNLFKKNRDTNSKAISKLNSIPRFKEGEMKLFEKTIYFPDSKSVISTYNGIFENEVYKFDSLTKHPLIIDLGANIGLSVLYFKQLYPNAKIIALEADPNIFKFLEKNISSFQLKEVTLINKAAYHFNTVLHFLAEGADGGKIAEGSIGTIEVEAIDVYTLFPENTIIDFLKIDIEGAEVRVLERFGEKLKFVKKVFIEYHSETKIFPQELSKIFSILENYGFRYHVQHLYNKQTPFLNFKETDNSFDLQLEIFAWK